MAEQEPKPPLSVELIWEHDLVFSGRSAGATMTLDSDGSAGPSPMQALAFGLAACMGMDVVHILRKGRHDLRGLRADLKGFRFDGQPRRFTRIELHFTATGTVAAEHVDRAIQLSREKYCSVWHSLRQDLELHTTFTVHEGV